MNAKLIYLSLTVCLLISCKNDNKKAPSDSYIKLAGLTMGTTYHITYDEGMRTVSQAEIDSILVAINLSASTYIDSSTISKINNGKEYGKTTEVIVNGAYQKTRKVTLPTDRHFIKNFDYAKRVYLDSDGAFDPTIMPLVNYWGFGYTPKVAVTAIDSQEVRNLLSDIGLTKINLEYNDNEMVLILPAKASLDFSALAKGYGVDVISKYLDDHGVFNYLVEIGGEVVAKGLSPRGGTWVIGLNTPKVAAQINNFIGFVSIDNKGMASSGNYRNYHVVEGQKYGHEINPKTGFPEMNEILGITVIAPTCMEADAWATAFMIMGKAAALQYANSRDDLEITLFTSDEHGQLQNHKSSGFNQYSSPAQNHLKK